MPAYRHELPQLTDAVFLTDGGIETTLIYDEGFDLPDFAAFPLLDDGAGRAALQRYFDAYLEIAVRDQVGIVLETPTWRASPDWGVRQSYSPERLREVNKAAVDFLVEARRRWERPATPVVISGCIGPRGDGYHPETLMTPEEARAYHSLQAQRILGVRGRSHHCDHHDPPGRGHRHHARRTRCRHAGCHLLHGGDRRDAAVGRPPRLTPSPPWTTPPTVTPRTT